MSNIAYVASSIGCAADEWSLGAAARVGRGAGGGQPAEEVRDAGARSY